MKFWKKRRAKQRAMRKRKKRKDAKKAKGGKVKKRPDKPLPGTKPIQPRKPAVRKRPKGGKAAEDINAKLHEMKKDDDEHHQPFKPHILPKL